MGDNKGSHKYDYNSYKCCEQWCNNEDGSTDTILRTVRKINNISQRFVACYGQATGFLLTLSQGSGMGLGLFTEAKGVQYIAHDDMNEKKQRE